MRERPGLGAMRMGMACSLLRAGFEVHGFDVNETAPAAFEGAGDTNTSTPAEASGPADIVVIVVVNAGRPRACSSARTVSSMLQGQALSSFPVRPSIQKWQRRSRGGLRNAASSTLTPRDQRRNGPCSQRGTDVHGLRSAGSVCDGASRAGSHGCQNLRARRSTGAWVPPSRSSNSCSPAYTSRPPAKRSRSPGASTSISHVCSKQLPSPPAIGGCSRTGPRHSSGRLHAAQHGLSSPRTSAIVSNIGRQRTFPLTMANMALQLFVTTEAAGIGRDADSSVARLMVDIAGADLPDTMREK